MIERCEQKKHTHTYDSNCYVAGPRWSALVRARCAGHLWTEIARIMNVYNRVRVWCAVAAATNVYNYGDRNESETGADIMSHVKPAPSARTKAICAQPQMPYRTDARRLRTRTRTYGNYLPINMMCSAVVVAIAVRNIVWPTCSRRVQNVSTRSLYMECKNARPIDAVDTDGEWR